MSYDRRNNENGGGNQAALVQVLQALSEGQAQMAEKLDALELKIVTLQTDVSGYRDQLVSELVKSNERREDLVRIVDSNHQGRVRALQECFTERINAFQALAGDFNQGIHTALKMLMEANHADLCAAVEALKPKDKPTTKEKVEAGYRSLTVRFREWNRKRLQKKLEKLQNAINH